MYFTSLLLALAAVPAMAVPWQHVGKRTSGFAASDATLYAYGNNISGLPLLLGATDGTKTSPLGPLGIFSGR